MKEARQIMGMPVTIMCPDGAIEGSELESIFDFLRDVDEKYSPYKDTSDVANINRKELDEQNYSQELKSILEIADKTKKETDGYFDVWHNGTFDPSGIVKGWAIGQAARLLRAHTSDFYIEIAGDIQVSGESLSGKDWKIGIRNPFDRTQNIAVVELSNSAIATSGTAIRGQHIYNPKTDEPIGDEVVSLSVITKDIVDADRIATAAFAMGPDGIKFIESLDGYEAYMVDKNKMATQTTNWHTYEAES